MLNDDVFEEDEHKPNDISGKIEDFLGFWF